MHWAPWNSVQFLLILGETEPASGVICQASWEPSGNCLLKRKTQQQLAAAAPALSPCGTLPCNCEELCNPASRAGFPLALTSQFQGSYFESVVLRGELKFRFSLCLLPTLFLPLSSTCIRFLKAQQVDSAAGGDGTPSWAPQLLRRLVQNSDDTEHVSVMINLSSAA